MTDAKIIAIVYALLCILFCIAPITADIAKVWPGMLVMWLIYFMFLLGQVIGNKMNIKMVLLFRENISRPKLLGISLFSILCAIIVVKYYTGNGLSEVIASVYNGESLYRQYQEYFAENAIGDFTLAKMPYVALMAIVRFSFLYICYSFFIRKQKYAFINWMTLLGVVLACIYIGIGRGTNFELFEIIICLFFSYNASLVAEKRKPPVHTIIGMGLFGLLAISIFQNVVGLRADEGVVMEVTTAMSYNSNSLFARLFPSLSVGLYYLAGYFVFGFFHTSTYLIEIWFKNFDSFLNGLLPIGILEGDGLPVHMLIGKYLDTGATWNPDCVHVIHSFGFIGLVIIILGFGIASKLLEKNRWDQSCWSFILRYFLLLQMISFPMGNFILTSSSNLIVFGVAILAFSYYRLPESETNNQ